jgi:hypothetical protein
MPLLDMAHEMSHENYEGKNPIIWSENQSSTGLFQIHHDDHFQQFDLTAGVDSLDHHCHHTSVIGMVTFVQEHKAPNVNSFSFIEPFFSIKSFPTLIDYPPINS